MIRPALLGLLVLVGLGSTALGQSSFAQVIDEAQPKIVKIFGAGGLRGLEAYQSGFLISGQGHILTVWSYVLDSDAITIYLNDGRKYTAEVVGMDPRTEIAVLKIDAENVPHFNLDAAVELETGSRVLAFSNLYGVAFGNEPASVLKGAVAAKADLAARRGAFETNYRGTAYVLDAMTNNPGAAGGALTDHRGNLAGLLGKELRSSLSNIWLNYAIPISAIATPAEQIIAGKFRPMPRDENVKKPKDSHSLALLGIQLVPDFLPKTPPFVESVRPASPAAKAGIRPDDLILFVNDRVVPSCKQLADELTFIDRLDAVRLTIQRGQELVEVSVGVE
ncbi:MAG: S1C family serine protease [Pirellulaceae bacterium]|nr:S1C family serine protease [Pirellulaceae bacterium]